MNILDGNLSLAVRCPNCGEIGFHNINVFELPLNSNRDFLCQCKCKQLTLKLKNRKDLIVNIPCLACDMIHTYRYTLKDILKKRFTVICCNETGLELCFLGREKDVKDVVSRYQENLNLLLEELGL